MLRDQCRAYCRCSYCANQKKGSGNANSIVGRSTRLHTPPAGMTKDELYAKSLRDTLSSRAMMESTKNATRFIPDEQLLSSTRRREAKEAAEVSQVVPLRRRDRLQELLLLEHKERLREEARLREERLALGLTDEVESKPPTPASDGSQGQTPSSGQRSVTSSQQRRLGSRGSGASTPSSRCSAEHDLHATRRALAAIAGGDDLTADDAQKPLTREQIVALRQLVHKQEEKSRIMQDECPHQPHLCNHCFEVNVQARRLCPQMTQRVGDGSVAFAQTGKVINPEEGVKFGTDAKPRLDGTYDASAVDPRFITSNKRSTGRYNYSSHPYGAGMVFLPVSSGSAKQQTMTAAVPYQTVFNNNIGPDEHVDAELQYPGSTYNVYDGAHEGGEKPNQNKPSTPPSGVASKSTAAVKASSAKSNSSSSSGGKSRLSAPDGKGTAPATSSSLWHTTNQARESDMVRFLEFQKKMHNTGKKVYEESASRQPTTV